jgi:hypothetical protein
MPPLPGRSSATHTAPCTLSRPRSRTSRPRPRTPSCERGKPKNKMDLHYRDRLAPTSEGPATTGIVVGIDNS